MLKGKEERLVTKGRISPHFSQISADFERSATKPASIVSTSSEFPFGRLHTLEKHPQHTDSMPAGVFRRAPRAPRIHNPFRLLTMNLVRNPG